MLDALGEVTVKVAVSAATAVGENFTLIVQLPEAGKVNEPVVRHGAVTELTEKSELPEIVIPLIESAVVVELFASVTVESALAVLICCEPNGTVEGERDIAPVAAIPLPLSGTDCGEFVALSVMTSEAERLPNPVGVKVTLTEQEVPARTNPQVLL